MTGLDGPWSAENRWEEESGPERGWRLVRARLGRPADGARRGEKPWIQEGVGGGRGGAQACGKRGGGRSVRTEFRWRRVRDFESRDSGWDIPGSSIFEAQMEPESGICKFQRNQIPVLGSICVVFPFSAVLVGEPPTMTQCR